MVTLGDAIGRVQSIVDDTAGKFYTTTEITNWINDGLRDLARRAEDLMSFDTSITIVANTAKYALPADVIRVHRAEFVPTGSVQAYPIQATTYQEMDTIWGTNQSTPSAYPSFFVIWGFPGGTGASAHKIQFYPVPSQGGTLNLFYYRQPYRFLDPVAHSGELVKELEVVAGWDDLVVIYAEAEALRKARDDRWMTVRQMYEGQIDYVMNVTQQWHDQQQFISTASRLRQPFWLYDFGE